MCYFILLLTFGFFFKQRSSSSSRRYYSRHLHRSLAFLTVVVMGLVPLCSILDSWGINTEQYHRSEGFNFSYSERDFTANLVGFVGMFPANLHDVVGVFPEHLVHDAFLPPIITGESRSFLKKPWPGDYDINVNVGFYTGPVDILTSGDFQTLIDIGSVLFGDSKILFHGHKVVDVHTSEQVLRVCIIYRRSRVERTQNQHQKTPWSEEFTRLMHFLHSGFKVLTELYWGFMSATARRQVVFSLVTRPVLLFHNYVGLIGTVKEKSGQGKKVFKTKKSLKTFLQQNKLKT